MAPSAELKLFLERRYNPQIGAGKKIERWLWAFGRV